MLHSILARLRHSDGLFARALRGSAFTAGSYVVAQGLRLASNLVLTRLLFPEAFGVMALVSVVLVGLAMFSDVGVGPAISQHPDGDDAEFLNTAYTINVLRGAALWLLTCALAWPIAAFYGLPQLMQLLPVAGLTLLILGFNPTRMDTAQRHLLLGRVTGLDLISQVLGIVVMVGLAWAMQSVWSLVVGALCASLAKLYLMQRYLPGPANRIMWQPKAGRDLIRFGKWIFLSSACGFLLAQGDKAILGAYLPLQALGVYNIAYFLAAFPMLLAGAITSRILIPLYRDRPPAASGGNAIRMRRLRFGLTVGTLLLLAMMGLWGAGLMGFLYDARYGEGGRIVVVMACVLMPGVVGMSYDQAALAAGDSRGFFMLIAVKALVQTAAFGAGVHFGGVFGALAAQAVAVTVLHGAAVVLARKHRVWDAAHDAAGFALAAALAGLCLWYNAALLGL